MLSQSVGCLHWLAVGSPLPQQPNCNLWHSKRQKSRGSGIERERVSTWKTVRKLEVVWHAAHVEDFRTNSQSNSWSLWLVDMFSLAFSLMFTNYTESWQTNFRIHFSSMHTQHRIPIWQCDSINKSAANVKFICNVTETQEYSTKSYIPYVSLPLQTKESFWWQVFKVP